ncbi:head decoration protein [Endozoicomonas euniceicola]|uniref:Head decoration protein n=1 Tax=Endozoicomonas euniceicola TaxID=1234143 RepID=A0ABY6H1K7_9GAMM|nr:head decoration protein [Endozoicomonas euniceicola]UYM18933.1 head decoration protein [Endozoicomonas euniceicola]
MLLNDSLSVRLIDLMIDLLKDPRSRDSGNTLLSKEFPGGVLMFTGTNSGASPNGWYSWQNAVEDFLVSEGNNSISRDQVVLAANVSLLAGTVLGKDASDVYTRLKPAASDGITNDEKAAAIKQLAALDIILRS